MERVYPKQVPPVIVERVDATPFEVECRELRWWFIVPEPDRTGGWATYDYPLLTLTEYEEITVLGATRVHGEACYEMRCQTRDADGNLTREAYAYGALTRGVARWFGWWNLSDEHKIYSWRDPEFDADWYASPVKIVDAGRYRWLDTDKVESVALEKEPPPWQDGIAAGVWRVRVDAKEHTCLRVLDFGCPTDTGEWCTLMEGFINRDGDAILSRRYNTATYQHRRWQEELSQNPRPTLTVNGTTFYRWYDCLTRKAFS